MGSRSPHNFPRERDKNKWGVFVAFPWKIVMGAAVYSDRTPSQVDMSDNEKLLEHYWEHFLPQYLESELYVGRHMMAAPHRGARKMGGAM